MVDNGVLYMRKYYSYGYTQIRFSRVPSHKCYLSQTTFREAERLYMSNIKYADIPLGT